MAVPSGTLTWVVKHFGKNLFSRTVNMTAEYERRKENKDWPIYNARQRFSLTLYRDEKNISRKSSPTWWSRATAYTYKWKNSGNKTHLDKSKAYSLPWCCEALICYQNAFSLLTRYMRHSDKKYKKVTFICELSNFATNVCMEARKRTCQIEKESKEQRLLLAKYGKDLRN